MPSNLQPRLMQDITDTIFEVSQVAMPKLDEKTGTQKLDFETKLPVWMVVLYARGRGWSAVFNVAVCNVEKPTADVCEQVQTWLNSLATTCQCCAQGKDARRPARQQRCCAAGACCSAFPATSTLGDARKVIRSALSHAQTEELVARNVAGLAKLPASRKRKGKAWSTD